AGGGLPQPVADLIMKGDVFLRRVDVDVIAQAIKQLGTIGLRIDRVHADVLAKNAAFRARSLGIDIEALVSLPHAGQTAQRAEIGQAVRRYVVGLGEDVFGNGLHVDSLTMCSCCHAGRQTWSALPQNQTAATQRAKPDEAAPDTRPWPTTFFVM